MMRVLAPLIALTIATAFFSCGKKESVSDNDVEPAVDGDPTPEPVETTTPPPLEGELEDLSSLQVVLPAESAAIGLADKGASLVQSSGMELVAIAGDGAIFPINIPNPNAPQESSNVSVSDIHGIGNHGLIVDFGHHAYDSRTASYWLKPNGEFLPFAPPGFDEGSPFDLLLVKQNRDGKIYVTGGAGVIGEPSNPGPSTLFQFDPNTEKFAALTSSGFGISDFTLTDNGTIYIAGQVLESNVNFIRRLKDDAGFEQIHAFSEKLYGFGSLLMVDNRFYNVNDDDVMEVRHLSIPNARNGANTPQVKIAERWLVTSKKGTQPGSILDLESLKVSGNPFKVNASVAIDLDGTVFDGANFSRLKAIGTALTISQQVQVVSTIDPVFTVLRVFGAQHGYSPTSMALVQPPGTSDVYMVPIDPVSGEIKNSEKKLFPFKTTNIGSSSADCFDLYRIGGEDFLFARCPNVGTASSLSKLSFDRDNKVSLTGVSLTNYPQQVDSYNHGRGLVNAGKLYLTKGNKIIETDGVAEQLLTPAVLSVEADSSCTEREVLLLAKDPTTTSPLLFLKACRANMAGADGTALWIVRYTDWSFTNVDDQLQVSTAQPIVHRVFYGENNEVILVGDKAHLLQVGPIDILLLQADKPLGEISLQGVRSFGQSIAGDFDVLLPLDALNFIYSGTVAGSKKSFRVNASSGAEIELTGLSGARVVSAYSDRASLRIMNTESTDDIAIQVLDKNGKLLHSSTTNGLRLRKIEGFPRP